MTEHEALQQLYIATGMVLMLWEKTGGDLRTCQLAYQGLKEARKEAELAITWTAAEFVGEI